MGRFLRNPPLDAAYEKQPLPLVGVFSNYNNSPECSLYDSDLGLVSRMTQSTGGNAFPTAGELWTDYANWGYTNGLVGSNQAGNYWVKATPCFSADGHQLLRLSAKGGMAMRHPGAMGEFTGNCGVAAGPEGYRQPMSLWCAGAGLRQYPRGGFAQLDCLTVGLNSASAAAWAGTDANMRGALGYHWAAGLLALIEARDADCNYRAHLWKHPTAKLSGKPGELNRFILEAKEETGGASYQYVDFSWSANNSTSYAESQYRMRVIPAKNGKIALVRFVPGNCSHMAALTPGSGNSGALNRNFTPVPCTTSYGIDKGNHYGMRHQIAWDNQWVAAFAPYYYYGSGLAGHVIDTGDPARYYRLSYASSACGVSILPIRESGFAYSFNDVNADGAQGLGVGILDSGCPGFQTTGALAVGGAVSLAASGGWIDTGYTSTNYPCLIPVENWKIWSQ